MKQAVLDIFPEFTKRLEGKVPWMYLDCLGYVTTGLGCLIDPVTLATDLPWLRRNGTKASVQEVVAEWHAVKDNKALAVQGHEVAEKFTRLRLSDEGVSALARRRLESNEEYFKQTWKNWLEFPADAQLAIMSMGWAMGAGFVRKFTGFTAAAAGQNWALAAQHCHIKETGNPGIVPRNKLNKKLLADAAVTETPELVTMVKPTTSVKLAMEGPIYVPYVFLTDDNWQEMLDASEKQLSEETP